MTFPNPAGRPSLLTRDLLNQIVDTVAVGNYLNTAAAYNGIGYSTLMLWQARGRAEQRRIADGAPPDPHEALYLELVERVHQAEARAQVAAVAAWRNAFAQDWRAARDYLAVKSPAGWGRREQITVTDATAEQRIEAAVQAAVGEALHLGTGQPPDDDEEGPLRALGGQAGP